MALAPQLGAVFLLAGAGSSASANGTACELGAAFCRGDATYWPQVEVMAIERLNDTATVTFRTFLTPPLPWNDTTPFTGSQATVAYGNYSWPSDPNSSVHEGYYPYRLYLPAVSFPGNRSATFVWPDSTRLFARVFSKGASVSNESESEPLPGVTALPAPAITVTRVVQSPSAGWAVPLWAGGVLVLWRRR